MDLQFDEWEQDYCVMIEGLCDYMCKFGFKKVVLGMLGGIDSVLVVIIVSDVIGLENVCCVMLFSEYILQISLDDVVDCVIWLGVWLDIVQIEGVWDVVGDVLVYLMVGIKFDMIEENIQFCLCGVMLMVIFNKFGELLLIIGNKFEVVVGYVMIYGDMVGGYNLIKDLYKICVFQICCWCNVYYCDWMQGCFGEVILSCIILKLFLVELCLDQKDEDSLFFYEVLDVIFEGLVEKDLVLKDLVVQGFDVEIVKWVEMLLYGSEWKCYQVVFGLCIFMKVFWLDWCYFLVNCWCDQF